jgi:hypothetical protein
MWVDYVRVYSATLPPPASSAATAYIFDRPASVSFSSPVPGARIRYTLDGSEPTSASALAEGPLAIATPCTITAIAEADGAGPSRACTVEVRAASAPLGAGADAPGLRCDYYEGDWKALPDFAALKPLSTAPAPSIALPLQRAEDRFALRFSGLIEAPASGLYTFWTASDDGSQLLIDGRVIVDNGGLHGVIERSGSVGLLAGKHRIEVRYLEASGGQSLQASWQVPEGAKTAIPAEVLSHRQAP